MADCIKYHYALDEQDKTVCIDNVSDEDKNLHTYHCMSCGSMMIPRRGKIREWHFAHKGNDEQCYETYIHLLSKYLIKKKFDDSDKFEICYYKNTECCSFKSKCIFFDENKCCKESEPLTYDLKKYYDTCEVEQNIGNYKADLLLKNSTKREITPILIEIQVTHKCEKEKIESGNRIIELRIRNEKDIENLLKTTLTEKYNAKKDTDNIGFAKFYGFKRVSTEIEPIRNIKTNRFYLFEDGNYYVEPISCDTLPKKKYPQTIFEVIIGECKIKIYSIHFYGKLLAIQHNAIKGFCLFCKHYKDIDNYWSIDKFCWLYKKYGTPQYPEQIQAKQCKYYREDKQFIGFLNIHMPKYIIAK